MATLFSARTAVKKGNSEDFPKNTLKNNAPVTILRKNVDRIFVVRSYMAHGDTRMYRLFDTRYFQSEKRARDYQREHTHYCGSASPHFNHATVDIEIYELKKRVEGKRVKRFSNEMMWQLQPSDDKKHFEVVMNPKLMGEGRCGGGVNGEGCVCGAVAEAVPGGSEGCE